MKKYMPIFFLCIILASGCGGIRTIAEKIEGTWYGYLPCASCPGIYYELSLNSDFTYSEVMQYEGTEDIFVGANRYSLTRDSVIILRGRDGADGMNRFAFSGRKLEMVSLTGERIEPGFPERYTLTRDKPVTVAKPVTPAGFRATGNEPFWGLEIYFGNMIRFTSLTEEYPELSFSMPDPEREGDLSVVNYRLKSDTDEAIVTISREECTDTMKGDLVPYRVSVSISRGQTEDRTVFMGCGQYLDSYRLNDIWILEKIDGSPVEIPGSRQHPRLEVDLAGRTIYGFGGCNRFQGRGELVNNTLVTGNIISTKMYCEDTQETENRFMRTLTGKTLEFTFTDDGLVLTDGETKLTFSRAG